MSKSRRRLSEEEEQKYGNAKFVTKTELVQLSDYISLHLPASSESFHFLDHEEFNMMKTVRHIVSFSN
jgi:phosphoglycerate dehydrogenase-like enzyme